MTVKEQMDRLTDELIVHAKKYYEEDAPEISDFEYDALSRQLRQLEQEYPQWARADSPTQRIGGEPLEGFDEVRHDYPMESLQDVFSYEELWDFDRKIKEQFPQVLYSVEVKIDGLSVALDYRDGLFYQGATRGNGVVGEDITQNLRTIHSIPLKIDTSIPRLVVRGEVYMPFEAFQRLNALREERGTASLCQSPECGGRLPPSAGPGGSRQAWLAHSVLQPAKCPGGGLREPL